MSYANKNLCNHLYYLCNHFQCNQLNSHCIKRNYGMNNRLSAVIIVVLLAVTAYFVVQNIQLRHHLNNAVNTDDLHSIPPVEPETKPANPEGTSPFDKPNVDPLASQFKPVPNLDTVPTTVMKFETQGVDFGRIKEGDVVEAQFKFVNAGSRVLLITHAQPSCGCTIPTTPREPVKPGDSSVISVVFHSEGKKGQVMKTVTLSANTKPRETVLTIRATVIPHEQ